MENFKLTPEGLSWADTARRIVLERLGSRPPEEDDAVRVLEDLQERNLLGEEFTKEEGVTALNKAGFVMGTEVFAELVSRNWIRRSNMSLTKEEKKAVYEAKDVTWSGGEHWGTKEGLR
jgi:hypothetical protein